MSSSPLTKVPCSALSPVSALSVRKHEQDKLPQSLSKQALELQSTLNKLKEAQSKKKLSNSNIVISSINNPVSSPQKNKRTEEQEDNQQQYKSLFKDIESPVEQNQSKAYSKMNKNDAETMFEQRKQQIKQHINNIKSNCKNKQQQKNKTKPVKQIDFSKSRIIKQKVESTPKKQQVLEKDMLHIQLKQMQKQLQSDIAKLDREIQGEHQISIPFDTKNKGHELYQQGLLMEDRRQFKKKIYEREKQLKEMEECTFQPKISQPSVKNSESRQQQEMSRLQHNQTKQKDQCKSSREQHAILKQLSRSHSQDLINSTTTTQIINNDLTTYLNKVEDKYQQIMQKANALKQKAL